MGPWIEVDTCGPGLRRPRWTPCGVQRARRASGHQARVRWWFLGIGVDPDTGWLPKNPALSLAIHRASPASIRFPPGRTRELVCSGDVDVNGHRSITKGSARILYLDRFQRKDPCARDRDARASPEDSQNLPKNRGFRLFEKCPADTFRFASRACDHSPRSARKSFISRKR